MPKRRALPPAPDEEAEEPEVGFLGLMALSARAWLAERTTDAQVRLLNAKARRVEAEYDARSRVLAARRRLEAELRALDSDLNAEAELVTLIRTMVERQAALEKQLAAQEKRFLEAQSRLGLPAVSLDVTLSQREIESIAGKTVKRISTLPDTEQDAAWATWKSELRERYPRLLAEEIEQKADELRQLFSG